MSFVFRLSFYFNYTSLLQDRRIRGLLEGCILEHDASMDALHGRVRERVQSDARWKQLQRESNKAVCELSESCFHFALAVKAAVGVLQQRDNSLITTDQIM